MQRPISRPCSITEGQKRLRGRRLNWDLLSGVGKGLGKQVLLCVQIWGQLCRESQLSPSLLGMLSPHPTSKGVTLPSSTSTSTKSSQRLQGSSFQDKSDHINWRKTFRDFHRLLTANSLAWHRRPLFLPYALFLTFSLSPFTSLNPSFRQTEGCP